MRKLLPILFLFFAITSAAYAQSANDLISEVNALRAEYGLEPYTVDSSLMSLAQEHSEYQASIQQTTHERADGSGVPCRSENICGGIGVNASYCVNNMWTDELHRYTMIGLETGTVGAGLAESNGNSYYTLMVNSSGAETGLASLTDSNSLDTPIDLDAALKQPGEFSTATPYPDGSIYHTVGTNETLWSIALSYDTTMAEIQQLNGWTEDQTDVSIGQRILIHYGGTPVADTLTPTLTPLPATSTPKPTATSTNTPIPLPSLTPTVTPTPTPEPLIPHIRFFDTPAARTFGLVLVIVCTAGLAATLYFGFFRKK
jgi:hypothetical protein